MSSLDIVEIHSTRIFAVLHKLGLFDDELYQVIHADIESAYLSRQVEEMAKLIKRTMEKSIFNGDK